MSITGYLLDTSVASAVWDGGHPRHAVLREWLVTRGEAAVFVSVITFAEVEYGLAISLGIDAERQAAVRSAMAAYMPAQILPIDRHTSGIYARLRAALFRRYAPRDRRGRLQQRRVEDLVDATTARQLGIQENDLWIIATAVQYDLRFVTLDAKLQRILEVAEYEERTDLLAD